MKTSILTKLLIIFISTFSFVTLTFAQTDDSFIKVKNKGTLTIGMDETFAPMGFKDKNGEITGFDVDLAKEVGKRLGIKMVFLPCVWDTIFLELKNGNINAIWNGVTINAERQSKALFTRSYMSNKIIILVRADSNFKKITDLNGKKIAAQSGSPAADYVKNYKGADFNPATLKEFVQYPDTQTAIYDLAKGGVDAVAVDEMYADYYTQKQKIKFNKLNKYLAKEENGVAFRKDAVALRDQIQAQLDAMAKDGTATKISMKWFGKDLFNK